MSSGYIEDPNEKDNLNLKLPPEPISPPPYATTDSRESLTDELHKVEEEIETLRLVLNAKVQRAAELRRRLGIYDFGVAKDDFRRTVENVKNSQAQTFETVKNSQAYLKTTSAVKTAASKTSEVVSKQWTNVRQTDAYKTVENTVGSFFKSIKNKMITSPPPSTINEFPAATATPVIGAEVGAAAAAAAAASAPPPPRDDLPHAYFMGDDGKFVAGDGIKKNI